MKPDVIDRAPARVKGARAATDRAPAPLKLPGTGRRGDLNRRVDGGAVRGGNRVRPTVPRVGGNPITGRVPTPPARSNPVNNRHRGHRRGDAYGHRVYGSRSAYGHHRTANHYHAQGYGTSSAVLWGGFANHYQPHGYHYGYQPFHSFGYRSHRHHHHRDRWYGGYRGTGYGSSYRFGFHGKRWRFSFGFGSYRSPWYHGVRYPRYRTYRYYPWHYYDVVTYYPAYSTCWTTTSTVTYVDSHDPYVDFVDEVPVGVGDDVRVRTELSEVGVPEAFSAPLDPAFSGAYGPSELLARGQGAMGKGQFLQAAEAFRRAWVARPTDEYAALELGFALIVAGEHDALARLAISSALDLRPSRLEQALDLRAKLPDPGDLEAVKSRLTRRLIIDPSDDDARFAFGYVAFHSGDWFGAHTSFTRLSERAPEDPHLAAYVSEVEKRIADER